MKCVASDEGTEANATIRIVTAKTRWGRERERDDDEGLEWRFREIGKD